MENTVKTVSLRPSKTKKSLLKSYEIDNDQASSIALVFPSVRQSVLASVSLFSSFQNIYTSFQSSNNQKLHLAQWYGTLHI